MTDEKFGLGRYSPSAQMIELKELEPIAYPRKAYAENWASYDAYGNSEDKIDFRELWRRVRKHKWLVLTVAIIVTTLVALQMYRTKTWYTASAVVEIGKENSMVLKSGDVTLNDDSDPFYLVNINTKKLALDNPELFEKVIVDQKLDQNPQIIEIVNKKSVLSYLDFSGEQKQSANPQTITATNPSTDTAEAKESLRLAPFVEYVQKNLTIEQVKNTRALKISYTNEDPQLAAQISNSIVKLFMQRNFNNQTERFTNSADWLDRSTRELKAKVQVAEEALAKYTRDNQIYSTDAGAENKSPTLTTARLTQLHDQFIRTQTERMLKKSLFEQVQAGRIAELPEMFSDPKITELQKQSDALEAQASELKVKFGPLNPKVMEVQNQLAVFGTQIETGRKSLEAKLKADYERAVEDEQSLGAALTSAKVGAVNENQASIKYNILKQDVETARGLYTDFLQKTNQAKAQVAEQNNNIKVIQQAQSPLKPDGPKRLLTIIAGFVLSLGIGVGLAVFLEYLDDTIKSLEDVERYAQLPTLGVIPAISKNSPRFFKAKMNRGQIAAAEDGSLLGLETKQNSAQTKLLLNLDNHSTAGEAYRALRTSLLLSAAGKPPKTILVTSSQASEGKSTTAVNTAIALAHLGAKVLLVDGDLRRPSVHKQLDISAATGLTNYLSSDTELDALIQELAIPNLSAIASGPIPPNPAELLSSQKMKDMLALLSESFDHIIIDAPPIINVTDPIILSTIVDGTIMVVHGGKTTRGAVQRSRQELSSVRARIFGVVLNNVNLRKEGYNYYYNYQYSEYKA